MQAPKATVSDRFRPFPTVSDRFPTVNFLETLGGVPTVSDRHCFPSPKFTQNRREIFNYFDAYPLVLCQRVLTHWGGMWWGADANLFTQRNMNSVQLEL